MKGNFTSFFTTAIYLVTSPLLACSPVELVINSPHKSRLLELKCFQIERGPSEILFLHDGLTAEVIISVLRIAVVCSSDANNPR
jgi:hypothetical protein